ncbi:MAG: hypothetical protein LC754_00675 [Acidobacteria bacterium]|nr:hypothetical protein [Acidobacteriota bacterium]
MRLSPKLAGVLTVCAAALPACFLGTLIFKYGVDVPFQEQWPVALYFEKYFQGTLALSDLFQQQNEFRQFFPNLLFLALGLLTRWNTRYEMLVIFLLACLISFNIYQLGALTLGDESRFQRVLALLLTNILIFSPLQYDTWLYGIQVVYLVPVACLTTCLLAAYSGLGDRTKFLICMCLSTVSTFSSANGILCWVVLLPVLVQPLTRVALFEKRRMLAAWVAAFLLNCALYLYDYHKPTGHPSLLVSIQHPLRAALYFFSYLGTPFGWGKLKFGILAGFILANCFALACAYWWTRRNDRVLARRMTGWLALGTFALLTGVMITLSRVGFGILQSSDLRYIAFSLYLTAALVHLAPIVLGDLEKKGRLGKSGVRAARLAPVALVLLLFLHLRFDPLGVHLMKRVWQDRERAKACLLFINVVPGACTSETDVMWQDADFLKRHAGALDAQGFLRPGLVKSGWLEEIETRGATDSEMRGVFESLAAGDGDAYVATGWARRAGATDAPADVVLLAYQQAGGASTVFKLSEPCPEHRPPTLTAEEVDCPDLHWRAIFSAGEIPSGAVELTAWAFDAETGRAVRLGGSHTPGKSGLEGAGVK